MDFLVALTEPAFRPPKSRPPERLLIQSSYAASAVLIRSAIVDWNVVVLACGLFVSSCRVCGSVAIRVAVSTACRGNVVRRYGILAHTNFVWHENDLLEHFFLLLEHPILAKMHQPALDSFH
jgi:hypothetical protein